MRMSFREKISPIQNLLGAGSECGLIDFYLNLLT